MCRFAVVAPADVGDFESPPGNSSDIMIIESPIWIIACIRGPSGIGWRDTSFAAIAFAAPPITRYGVTVCMPRGTAFTRAVAVRFLAVACFRLPARFAFRAIRDSPTEVTGDVR